MSFLKKLFGGGSAGPKTEPAAATEHEGYTITPAAMKEGGQFRLSGTISKEIDGEMKTHSLIRADLFSSADECNEFLIRKAKQVIKEQGDQLFH